MKETSDPLEGRRGLTFSQAEGLEPLPAQMELRSISDELAAVLWAVVYTSLQSSITSEMYGVTFLGDPWASILKTHWVTRQHNPIDDFPGVDIVDSVKKTILFGTYAQVFDLLQYLIQRPETPHAVRTGIERALIATRCAYRVIENHIVPISNDEQIRAVKQAIDVTENIGASGTNRHLRNAVAATSSGKWADAVRESIHAVEGAARLIEPEARTLGPALSRLRKAGVINASLEKAFGALYGFVSGPDGIRHALVLEDKGAVDERDAIFMLGACSSFVTYLLMAARAVTPAT